MLTPERAQILANYLEADLSNAKNLLELSPEEAVQKINKAGFDFSFAEITEFGEQLKKAAAAAQDGELSEDALSGVAGGIIVEGVAISCIALGFKIGSDLAKNYGW